MVRLCCCSHGSCAERLATHRRLICGAAGPEGEPSDVLSFVMSDLQQRLRMPCVYSRVFMCVVRRFRVVRERELAVDPSCLSDNTILPSLHSQPKAGEGLGECFFS